MEEDEQEVAVEDVVVEEQEAEEEKMRVCLLPTDLQTDQQLASFHLEEEEKEVVEEEEVLEEEVLEEEVLEEGAGGRGAGGRGGEGGGVGGGVGGRGGVKISISAKKRQFEVFFAPSGPLSCTCPRPQSQSR